jgi:hypothetical protein
MPSWASRTAFPTRRPSTGSSSSASPLHAGRV